MKTFEFLLLVFCVFITVKAFAFTTSTGQGYFTWNSQVISYYNQNPGSSFNLQNGITATDTNDTPTEPINSQAFNAYVCSVNPNQKQCS